MDLPEDFFPHDEQAIKAKDLAILAALPVLTAVAWSCSDSVCLKLALALTRLLHRLQPDRYREFDQNLRDFRTDGSQPHSHQARVIETAALHHVERLQLLRYYRPGSWRPTITVAGQEHLERALAQGKGAILWVTSAVFSDMVSKVALRELGYDVWHLSRHVHGHFSWTRFGIRFLNPIRIAVECRFLAERVVIDPADPKIALGRLEALLAQNEVVSITVGAHARRVTMVEFGPGYLPLAGGAPSLALRSGAALLPVFTERRDDGSFLVTIEPALEAPADLAREQKIIEMIVRECALLRRYFERLPAQFHYADLHHIGRRCAALVKDAPKSGDSAR